MFSRIRRVFLRDMTFICIGLGLYYVFLENFSINLYETGILIFSFFVYVAVVYIMERPQEKKEDALDIENAKNREDH